MKNSIKKIKEFLAGILTVLIIIFLFGVIFIRLDLVQPTASFFLELSAVIALTIMMKVFWYDYAEDKRLSEQDITDEKKRYYQIVDENIEDSNDLDDFLIILNQENKQHYIDNKIGSRSPKTLAKKTKLMCLFHPSYKKLTKEEIGELRYTKLYFKCQRKADKLKPITSEQIMALSDKELLYDAKNHAINKKRSYQIMTTIFSFALTTLIASMAMREIMLNWTNAFRFVGYLCSMIWAMVSTIVVAYKNTGDETFDHLNRLKFIVDKYVTYRAKITSENKKENVVEEGVQMLIGGFADGELQSNDSVSKSVSEGFTTN